MTPDWGPLRRELACWRAAGRVPTFWWRDDDAVEATAALDRLEALAETTQVSVHLAVIPAKAQASLGARVGLAAHLIPVVHGWAHQNHAAPPAKKSEFGQPRAGAADELRAGMSRLRALFGARLVPMFVPPWNRLDERYLDTLVEAGFRAVSAFGAPPQKAPLPFINTHLDPVDWRGTRSLASPEALVAIAVAELQARRKTDLPHYQPFGLLTHHLVHDAQLWAFCAQFLTELRQGGAKPAPVEAPMEYRDEQT